MNFYRFWQIIEENYGRYGRFPERPDSPPEYPTWEDKDLVWDEWDEDGNTVRLVGGRFVDERGNLVPFLDKYAPLVSKWDQTNGMMLAYEKMYGTLQGSENPRTGEEEDDEVVRVELKNAYLGDYSNDQNKIELPNNMLSAIKVHYFKGYE